MLLNARKVVYDESDTHTILLAFLDVTEHRVPELESAEFLIHTEERPDRSQQLSDAFPAIGSTS
jgi:hypothetical protein